MKRYIYSIAILFGALTLSSCNPMDNEPTDSYTDKNFWTDIDKAQTMLNMAYSQMYSAGKMWSDERLTDNLYEGRGYTDQRSMRNGTADTSTDLFESEWSDLYGGIKTCHVILANIDKLEADASTKAYMIAQTRYIRAAIYFRLTNFYGDIPFFTKDISLAESKTISRTSHDEVVKFIHSELDEILPDLPTREQLSADENGKITKGAALMLQARAYLYESDWANVEKYCSMLMSGEYGSYSLFNSYAGLFTQENEYNCEVIMDCSYVPLTRTWSDMLDMCPISKNGRVNSTAPTQSLVDNYLTLDGYTIDEAGTTYNENNPYDNRDPRLTATVVYHHYKWAENVPGSEFTDTYINIKPGVDDNDDTYKGTGSNATSTGYYVRKYYDPEASASMSSGLNIITMRYADVLLMYAEAMNEQNKMTEEVWNNTIRPIRQRAGFTKAKALDYPNGDQASLRKILRSERNSELALEGLRWFDIKRWQAGEEYLSKQVRGAKFADNNTKYIELDNYKFNKNRDYLWSVPQSQMDINPNLKPNNPGYAN
jgi:starch-binding outer membrane protein, SusD/RagB family